MILPWTLITCDGHVLLFLKHISFIINEDRQITDESSRRRTHVSTLLTQQVCLFL